MSQDNPIRIDLYSQARREKTDRERGLARASAVVSRVHARNPPFQSRAERSRGRRGGEREKRMAAGGARGMCALPARGARSEPYRLL